MRRARYRKSIGATTVLVTTAVASIATGQTSLEERLDDEAYLRRLVELDLPELVDHFIETRPPADAIVATEYQIASAGLRWRDASRPAELRRASLESMLVLRGELIETHPDDERCATWAADQAADCYFELFPSGGSGVTTMFGLPTGGQRATAEQAITVMAMNVQVAEDAIDRAIRGVEAHPDYRSSELLQMRRRRLTRDERDRRIPFLGGVAAQLEGMSTPDATLARDRMQLAVDLLTPLRDVMEGIILNEVRVHEALARSSLGEHEQAHELLVAAETDSTDDPMLRFTARLGIALNRARERGAEAGARVLDAYAGEYAGPEHLFHRMLMNDLRCRLYLDGPGPVPAVAVERYLDLLEGERGTRRSTLRAIVLQKLAIVIGDEANLDTLPMIATIARAERLLKEDAADAAIKLLERATARRDVSAADHATATFVLGEALRGSDRTDEAIARFASIARSNPDAAEAWRAIDRAAVLARRARVAAPENEEVRARYRDVLELIVAEFGGRDDATRWWYARGRLALAEGAFDIAETAFRSIPGAANEWIDAQFMYVSTLRAAAIAAGRDGDARGSYERRRRVRDEAAAVIATLEPLRGGAGDRAGDLEYYLATLRVYHAEALLLVDTPERALAALDGIEREPDIDQRTLAMALRVRIDAFRALDDADGVRREMERFLSTAPESASVVVGALLGSLVREIESMVADGRGEEAWRRAAIDVLPLVELAAEWVDAAVLTADDRARLTRLLADGLRLAEHYGPALARYDMIDASHGGTAEVLYGRAECLVGLGGDERLADAMRVYKRLAASSDGSLYWSSQLRMLQILDRAGRNTDQIAPRIARLRLQDETLGGERYRREFLRLESKHR